MFYVTVYGGFVDRDLFFYIHKSYNIDGPQLLFQTNLVRRVFDIDMKRKGFLNII